MREPFLDRVKDLAEAREKYYGLLGWERPAFPDAELPDPRTYVDNNEEAIIQIAQALNGEKSQIILIYADAGIGKSCFRREMVTELEKDSEIREKFKFIVVDDPGRYTDLQLLRLVGDDLGIDFGSKWNNREAVVSMILQEIYELSATKGMQTLVVVDEAQKLSIPNLDTLKQFSDIEYGGRKACKIILLATNEIFRRLSIPTMEPLVDRILIKYLLKGFDFKETAEFVARWIAFAKGEEYKEISGTTIYPFTPEAIETIHRLSKGHPRTVRKLCALSIDIRIESPGGDLSITPEIVEAAMQRLI
ncbi:MAG: ExeA family protein [Promethearchaeota archaeon]